MSDYIYFIKNYNMLNSVIILFPVLLWTVIIKNYFLTEGRTSIPLITVPILLLPYIIILYNWYVVVMRDKGINMHPSYGFCSNTSIPPEMKRNGVIDIVNLDCHVSNERVVSGQADLIMNRFYYVNYVILFLVVIIYDNIEHIFKNKKEILKILALAAGLSIFGSLAAVFSHSGAYSILIQRFISGLLNMNVAVAILVLLYILRRVYGDSKLL